MVLKFFKKTFLPFWKNGKALLIRRQNNILSAAMVLMVMIFSSGILGLLRDRLLAGYFFAQGEQWKLDIYFAAFRLPDMLFQILVLSALSAAFIPVFSEYLTKDKKEANYFASLVLNIGTILFLFVAALVFIFSNFLNGLITHGFEPEQMQVLNQLTRMLLGAQFFFLLSNFLSGILQSNQRFLMPAFSSVLYNLGIILGIVFLTPPMGIYGPVLGVIFGSFLHFIIQLPIAKRLGFNYQFVFNWNHPGVKKVGRLMLPRVISFTVNQLRLNVIVYLATTLSSGSLAMYNFAQHLNSLPVSLFGLTIGQAALPTLSREIKNNLKNFSDLFLSSLLQIIYFAFPVGIILLVLRVPMVRLAFGAKNFPWEATLTTAKVVGVLSIFLVAKSTTQLLIRTFYAIQDTVIPLLLRVINVLINIVLALVFIYSMDMGIVGLALAEGIAEVVFALTLFLLLHVKVGGLIKRDFLLSLGKIVLGVFLTALFLWIPMRILDRFVFDTTLTLNLILLTIITLLIGGGVYVFFSFILDISQFKSLLAVLKRFGKWKEILAESGEVFETSQPASLPPEKD